MARTPIHDDKQSLWLAAKKQHNATTNDDDDQWQWIVPTIITSDRPSARVAHAQASVGDTIYIFGGRDGINMGENAMNDMWMLQIVDGSDDNNGEVKVKWTQIHDDAEYHMNRNVPQARSFHKMIAVDTDIYMFGGCGSKGRLNDLWKFDTITNMWRCLGTSHLLKGRGGPNILSLSNGTKIGIVAGFAGEETNDGHVYDVSKLAWEEKGMEGEGLSNMRPRSVCCFATLSKNNTCIIFGGEVDPSQKGHEGAGGFENDAVVLDGSDGSVMEIIKKPDDDKDVEWPGPRGWSDATTHEDTFYMFGGLAGDDTSPVRLGDLWQCKVTR